LGAQPPGLAFGAAQPPPGALGSAGGAAKRAQALGGALLVGVGEPLPVHLAGELSELVHDGHLPSFQWWWLAVVSNVVTGAGGHHT
jgi:hypothetical protein